MYASVNDDIIGLDNSCSPVWHYAIIWFSADLLFTKSITNLCEPESK